MVHFKHSFPTINMYHFINLKIVYHSNRGVRTDTNNAGDDHWDVMALVFLSHGDLEAKTFPAIPHMPHEMAWFNVCNPTSAAL